MREQFLNWQKLFLQHEKNRNVDGIKKIKMKNLRLNRLLFLIAVLIVLFGCQKKTPSSDNNSINRPNKNSTKQSVNHPVNQDSAPSKNINIDVSKIPNAIPKEEPRSKNGNPPSYEVFGKRYYVLKNNEGYSERGIASWYGIKFHKQRTSSGEPYDMYGMTAAHKTLPLPTYAKVTNLENGREVIVKINDRGPFLHNRLIDLSYTAAKKLGVLKKGTALVDVTTINPREWKNGIARNTKKITLAKPMLYLQVGAFSTTENAKQLASRLKTFIQYPIKVVPNKKINMRNKKPMYLVRVGPLKNTETFDRINSKIQAAGLKKTITVIE